MDPVTALGVAAAAFQFADVCVKVISLIKNAQGFLGDALAELAATAREAETVRTLSDSMGHFLEKLGDFKSQLPQKEQHEFQVYLEGINKQVKATGEPLNKLETILLKLQPPKNGERDSRIDALKTLYRVYRKEDAIQKLQGEVTAGRTQLEAYFSALHMIQLLHHHNLTTDNINRVSKDVGAMSGELRQAVHEFRLLSFELKEQRHLMDHAEHPVDQLLRTVEFNQHYKLVRSVEKFYAGREDLLEELGAAFSEGQADSKVQKRFVVYGFPGTGKTEFSNKFAEKYKQSFWGIFVVDATSHVHAVNSFCSIAKLVAGKDVENDINAAKQWLAECKYPWLLIIDNADDTKLDIKQYYPPGNTGCVLITTRNWLLRSEGNVGKGYYNFERLEKTAAKQVLMEAAAERVPWKPKTVAAADRITDELECLPLALVYAGKAIQKGLCEWRDYIGWYKETRRTYSKKGASSSTASGEDNVKLTIIPTFDPLIRRLERPDADQTSIDARELIYTFGFLHHSNITFSLLKKAVTNANIDALSSADTFPDHGHPPPEALGKRLANNALKVASQYERLFMGPPTLPDVLKSKIPYEKNVRRSEPSKSDRSDDMLVVSPSDYKGSPIDQWRLRNALSLLEGEALIKSYRKEDDDMVYSLHPLVHTWIRERFQKTWYRALWCEAAAQALSQCIVLESEAFAGQPSRYFDPSLLLPHVESLRKYEAEIEAEFVERRASRSMLSWPPVLVSEPYFVTRIKNSQRLVRYSLVYGQMGKYTEAGGLQGLVQDRAVKRFGMNHEMVIQISLALAQTKWNLGEFTQSCDIQGKVVEACKVVYGPSHFLTFDNIDRLGLSLLYGGRLLESKTCHQRALAGFMELEADFSTRRSPDAATQAVYYRFAKRCKKHSLIVMSHLGAIEGRYLNWEESKIIIEEALTGLEELFPDDDEVVWAKENLAFTCCELEDEASRVRARELMEQVRDERRKRLGKQHPFTLWAYVNLGRALWKLSKYDEALENIKFARRNAKVTLGKSHFGFLVGEVVRGGILIDKGAYDKALKALTFVDRELERISIERKVDHLDRVIGLRYQMNLFELMGNLDEAIKIGRKILDMLQKINKEGRGVSHPFYSIVVEKVKSLEDKVSSGNVPAQVNLSAEEQIRRRTIKGETSPSR